MGGKSGDSKVPVNDYHMSIHLGVCHGPVDALLGIVIGDKEAWTGTATTEQTITINKPSLFGGNKKEGGAVGQVRFMPGVPAGGGATMHANLAARLGVTPETCPAYTGLANLFFVDAVEEGNTKGFLWGSNNPYIKGIWTKVRRRSNTFAAGSGEPSNYADMGTESNPAHMIYECLTNRDWGMGESAGIIDVDSFRACAKTFYQESFGLSMMWTQQAKIESFIEEILDHVQATLFTHPRTGLLTLKAVRDDYDPDDLETLNADNCRITKFQRKVWGETINEIVVTWTNPVNEQEETVVQHDLASIEMQGGIVSDTRNYYGVRSVSLAMALAARDIRTAAAPLASFDIEANRTLQTIFPGNVIKLDYPELGIEGLILRIGNVDYGRPGDSTIRFSAIEDIFGLPQTAYTVPSESAWENPARDPTDMNFVQGVTLPYFFAAAALAPTGQNPTYPEVLAGMLGASTNDDARSFELYSEIVQPNGELAFENVGTKPLIGRSTLTAKLPAAAESTVNGTALGVPWMTPGAGPVQSGFVLIGSGGDADMEIALIYSMASNLSSIVLHRGVLDTVPRSWPVGTPIWFIDASSSWADRTYYADGDTGEFKLLTTTSRGTLDLEDATLHELTFTGRPHYPFRPANVAVEGIGFGPVFVAPTETEFEITWGRRNRTTEDSQVLPWGGGDITPEEGQTTTVTVLDMDRNVLAVHDGLTGTSFTVPVASFAGNNVGIVRVTAVRDGFESLQGHEIVVSFGTGYGTDYGNNYGDD